MENSYRYLIIAIFVLSNVSFLSTYSKQRKAYTFTQKTYCPENTLIAFDIDEVIISGREYGYKKWFLYPSRWSFGLALSHAKKKYHLHDAYAIVDNVVQHHPKFARLAEKYKKVLITGKPIKDTLKIIDSLQKQGYTVIPASNMTKSTYKEMIAHNVLPSTYFNTNHYFVKTKKCNRKVDGSYYKKPNIEYFQNLKAYTEKKYSKKFENIVFIDDKKRNVRGARKAGIDALRFKKPQQLRQRFHNIGIRV